MPSKSGCFHKTPILLDKNHPQTINCLPKTTAIYPSKSSSVIPNPQTLPLIPCFLGHMEIPQKSPRSSTLKPIRSTYFDASPAAAASVSEAPPGGSRATRPHRNADGRRGIARLCPGDLNIFWGSGSEWTWDLGKSTINDIR